MQDRHSLNVNGLHGRHLREAVHGLVQRISVAVEVVVGVLRRGVRVGVPAMLGLWSRM